MHIGMHMQRIPDEEINKEDIARIYHKDSTSYLTASPEAASGK